ncbi:MAG: cytochrome c oxidase subunit II [Spirochaetales bacterium]|nr:cytochrome c oxidase subunit II [Spirochaetales bacterium]
MMVTTLLRILRRTFPWLLAALVVTPAWPSDFLVHPVSAYSGSIDAILWVTIAISIVFFALVVGIMAFVFFRFRAKKAGEEGVRIHGNVPLEIVWTVVPAIILVALSIWAVDVFNVELNPPESTLIVKVTAYQFGFDFSYYESSPNFQGAQTVTVHNICGNPAAFVKIRSLGVKTHGHFEIPQGVPVRFLVTSKDVIHSFWVPAFMIKRDTVPGLSSDMWLTPTTVGTYPVKCAVLCGPGHDGMRATLKVVPKAEFSSWLAAHKTLASR